MKTTNAPDCIKCASTGRHALGICFACRGTGKMIVTRKMREEAARYAVEAAEAERANAHFVWHACVYNNYDGSQDAIVSAASIDELRTLLRAHFKRCDWTLVIFHKCTIGDVYYAFMGRTKGLATWYRDGEGRDTVKAALEAVA